MRHLGRPAGQRVTRQGPLCPDRCDQWFDADEVHHPRQIVGEPKRLHRQNPKTHTRPSLRKIAAGLAAKGMVRKSGKPYSAAAIRRMLLNETSRLPT